MAALVTPKRIVASAPMRWKSILPGLVLAAIGVVVASSLHGSIAGVPFIVAAVFTGVLFANTGLVAEQNRVGLDFASKTVLRAGIVLLGLRLSLGDVAALGWATLAVLVATVSITFFSVQFVGRKLGLSPGLSLLVASGFSICGNSAIASVSGATPVDEDEVAAAVGLVTLCGTAAIAVVPALGSVLGLDDPALGVWVGASVQDTAQVIAVASTVGPAVLAVATAVKLTRVLFLAPIVAAVSMRNRSGSRDGQEKAPALVPLFVLGFLAALLLRTSGLLPDSALALGRSIEGYALAAGMVGLGSSVSFAGLKGLGFRPLLLGLMAWVIVGGVSLAAISLTGQL